MTLFSTFALAAGALPGPQSMSGNQVEVIACLAWAAGTIGGAWITKDIVAAVAFGFLAVLAVCVCDLWIEALVMK